MQRDLKIQVRIRIESHIIIMYNQVKRKNMVQDITTVSYLMETEKNLRIEKKSLEQLQKRGASPNVIAEQQKVVCELKEEYEEAKAATERIQKQLGETAITFNVVDDATGKSTNTPKKIAFVKNNRPINSAKVDSFISLIANGKYESAFPIIVAEAKFLMEKGHEIYNLKNEKLSAEEADNYFVILDGQHRCCAFARLVAADGKYEIPNVHIRNKENIGAYLVDINETGTSWNNKDRLSVAALTAKEHSDLFSNIAMLMSQGFNPSAASMILAKVKLSTKAIKQALKGEHIKLPQRTEINIERGHKFVTLCNAAGITTAFVTKRYFIEGFNSYAASNGEEKAFEALQRLRNLNLSEKDLKSISAGDDFSALLKKAIEIE